MVWPSGEDSTTAVFGPENIETDDSTLMPAPLNTSWREGSAPLPQIVSQDRGVEQFAVSEAEKTDPNLDNDGPGVDDDGGEAGLTARVFHLGKKWIWFVYFIVCPILFFSAGFYVAHRGCGTVLEVMNEASERLTERVAELEQTVMEKNSLIFDLKAMFDQVRWE